MKKRILVLLLAILSLTGCGKIKLEDSNYSDYMDIITTSRGEDQFKVYLGIYDGQNWVDTADEYSSIYLSVYANGVSSNYEYENVEVEVHFYGDLPLSELTSKGLYRGKNTIIEPSFERTGKSLKVDKTIKVKCDVSGKAKILDGYSDTISLEEGQYVDEDALKNIKKEVKVTGYVKHN